MIPGRAAILGTAVLALLGVMAALAPAPQGLRFVLAAPLALLLPGYALAAALFPGRSLDSAERWLLTGALSLAATIIVGVGLYAAGIRLEPRSWAWALTGLTVLACLVAERRRRAAGQEGPARPWRAPDRSWLAPTLMAAAALGLVVAAVVLVRQPLASPVAKGYTALWLAPDRSDARRVVVGVASHEAAEAGYRLRFVVNGRLALDQTLELAPGERVETAYQLPYRARPGSVIRVRMYSDLAPGRVYRTVRMRAPGTASAGPENAPVG